MSGQYFRFCNMVLAIWHMKERLRWIEIFCKQSNHSAVRVPGKWTMKLWYNTCIMRFIHDITHMYDTSGKHGCHARAGWHIPNSSLRRQPNSNDKRFEKYLI